MKNYNRYRNQMLVAADRGDMTTIFNVVQHAVATADISNTECMHLFQMACELVDAVCCGNGPCGKEEPK